MDDVAMPKLKTKFWMGLVVLVAMMAVGAIPIGIYYVSQQNKQTRYADALKLAKLMGVSESEVISTIDYCDSAVCIRRVYFRTAIGREQFVTRLQGAWPVGKLLFSESNTYLDQSPDGSVRLGNRQLKTRARISIANDKVLKVNAFCRDINVVVRSGSMDRSLCYFTYFSIRDGGYSFQLDGSVFSDDILVVELQS
jgi:hypothetical protein